MVASDGQLVAVIASIIKLLEIYDVNGNLFHENEEANLHFYDQ